MSFFDELKASLEEPLKSKTASESLPESPVTSWQT
jgi:hypothetical protein